MYGMAYWVASIFANMLFILVWGWILEWIFKKLALKFIESLGYATKTVSITAVATALNLWILTQRPQDRTLEMVAPVLIAGVWIAGGKIFDRTRKIANE